MYGYMDPEGLEVVVRESSALQVKERQVGPFFLDEAGA